MSEFFKAWCNVQVSDAGAEYLRACGEAAVVFEEGGPRCAKHRTTVDLAAIEDAVGKMAASMASAPLSPGAWDERVAVAEAMVAHGGHFVSSLGRALQYADGSNTARIREAFPDYWASYLELARADILSRAAKESRS